MIRLILTTCLLLFTFTGAMAQNFEYQKIYDKALSYTVAVNLVIEVSFGTQTTEAKNRVVGTIVDPDGLVLFDGTSVDSDDPFSVMSGMEVDAEPKSIEIVMMDGTRYPAEYIGIDRFTKLAFCRITPEEETLFDYVTFKQRDKYNIGQWMILFTLLPEFVDPPLSMDIGLVSNVVEKPEEFILTVGFNELQIGAVLYDSTGSPLGTLGNLENPALSGFDVSSMMESFSQFEDFLPLLGLIEADRLKKLIKNPPEKGKPDRGWMGIYLQALTTDLAEFWGLETDGGIIVNDVVNSSPADSAGIKTGDIIIGMFGKPIEVNKEENLPIFQKRISEMGADSEVDFTILRRTDGQADTVDISLFLARAPLTPAEAPEYEDENFEFKVRDMVFADYNINNLDRKKFKGVVVKEVESGGWAQVGGLFPGDIIQTIDGDKVTSIKEAEKVLKEITEEKPDEVIFFVWRDNKTLFINIKTDWPAEE